MTSPTASRRRPPGRYDPPSMLGARFTALVLSVLFVALIAAVLVALYDRLTGERVQARVIDFQVLSDSRVRIDLEVVKPEGSTAYCYVRSRSEDGAEVGREVVVVDPVGTADKVVRLEHDLTTSARPVTGEAGRCSASPIPTPAPSP